MTIEQNIEARDKVTANFGQRPFVYPPPDGFLPLGSLTDWFNGDVPPAYPGVYLCEFELTDRFSHEVCHVGAIFRKFDGEAWYEGADTTSDADSSVVKAKSKIRRWRGLAEKSE